VLRRGFLNTFHRKKKMSDEAYIKELRIYIETLETSVKGLELSNESELAEKKHTDICLESASDLINNLEKQINSIKGQRDILVELQKHSGIVVQQNGERKENLLVLIKEYRLKLKNEESN